MEAQETGVGNRTRNERISIDLSKVLPLEPADRVELGQRMVLNNLVYNLDGDHKANVAFLDFGSVQEVALSLSIEVIILDEEGSANLQRVSITALIGSGLVQKL